MAGVFPAIYLEALGGFSLSFVGQKCSTYPLDASDARKRQRKASEIHFQDASKSFPNEDAYRIVYEYLRSKGISATLESSSFEYHGTERIKIYLGHHPSPIVTIVIEATHLRVFFSSPVIVSPSYFDLYHPNSLRDLAKALRNASNIE